MASVATLLTSNQSNTDATSYATAAVSPAAGSIIVAIITARRAAGSNGVEPSFSGCAATWLDEIPNTFQAWGFNNARGIKLAIGIGPFTNEAVTASYGATTQSGAIWDVVQVTEINTTTPNVQANVNADEDSAAAVALAAFADAMNNVVISAFVNDEPTTWAGEHTELADHVTTENAMRQVVQWQIGEDTTPSATPGEETSYAGVAIELDWQAAGVATVVKDVIGPGIVAWAR